MFARSCLARVTAAPSVCLLKPSATSTPLLSLLRLTNTSKRPFSTTPSHHLPRPPPIPSFRRPSSSPPENQNPPHEKTSIGRITPVRIPASAAIDGGGGNSASAASVGTNQNAAAQGEAVEHLSVDYCMEGKEDPYEVERPNVLAYLAWALGTSGGIFVVCALLTNRDTEIWAKKLGNGSYWRRTEPSQTEMQDAKRLELASDLQQSVNTFASNTSFLPETLQAVLCSLHVYCAESWLNASDSRRFAIAVVAINSSVFIAWRMGRLIPWMQRNFTHHPTMGRKYTMLTSTFSHESLTHFGFNMLAFWSFCPMVYAFLLQGDNQALSRFPSLPESTSVYHLIAFYCFAGIFSSLVSTISCTFVGLPRLRRALAQHLLPLSPKSSLSPTSPSAFLLKSSPIPSSTSTLKPPLSLSSLLTLRRSLHLIPSLGASGALYAIVVIGALSFPAMQVSLIFLPFFKLNIGSAVLGMVVFDVVGLIRGWKALNHVAHLGGGAIGAFYWQYGCGAWDWLRMSLASLTGSGERKKER